MIPDHLWQSTLFAGLTALLALALRNNQARARYWLWLIASAKFLVPFSLLVALGRHIEWSSPPNAQKLTAVVGQISQPFTQEQSFAAVNHDSVLAQSSGLPAILAAIWICGFAGVAIVWWRRWRRVHAVIRAGLPLPLSIGLPVLSSPMPMEPGVFGLFRPVLLLPEGITKHLSAEQLEAVIAHEMCHVRRRDNLTAAIHMAVEAIFWFHPLVWWLGARLVEERERACDEEVLRLGNEPQIYAESILKTCQFYLESPLTCVSGITGADLKQRVIRIMTQRLEQKLDIWRKSLLAAAGVAAVAGPILVGLLHAPPSQAKSQRADTQPAPTFEVASVKPNHGGTGMMGVRFMGPRYTATNVGLNVLIQNAYLMKEPQLLGLPDWVKSERYDVDAKIDDATLAALQKMTIKERGDQVSRMLQALLTERFKISIHHDTKELPIYALLAGRSGSKLKETTLTAVEMTPPAIGRPPQPGQKGPPFRMMGPGQLTGAGVGADAIADMLSRYVGRVVVDKTGLNGKYDFSLKWTPDDEEGRGFQGGLGPGSNGPPPDPNGPSLFAAVQEQLGLKLDPQKSNLDVLVFDHVERPSEN